MATETAKQRRRILARQDVKARRRDNVNLLRSDRKASNLLRNRYGIDAGRHADADERQKAISLANQRLSIKPTAVDPTRKVSKRRKAIAGAFSAIDSLVSGSEGEINNTAARGEALRIRELAEGMKGPKADELEELANEYLKTFKKNRKIGTGQGFADAIGHLRDIQQGINDLVNVDFLSDNYNLKKFSGAALTKGLTVGQNTNELVFGKSYQQAVADRDAYNKTVRDHNDSYAGDEGPLWFTMEENYSPISESNYAAGTKDLPWWAK